MVQPIGPETALWITIDVILGSLAIYLFVRYIKLKRNARSNNYNPTPKLSYTVLDFRSYLERYGRKEAVISAFNEIVSGMVRVSGINIPKSFTMKEIVNKLNDKISRKDEMILYEMYDLYERVRFGDHEPSDEEIDSFTKRIESISKFSISPQGEYI
ncbi:MAG: hypothetical protein ABDH32_01965 [Candidatus Caldarchaeales archaeon]